MLGRQHAFFGISTATAIALAGYGSNFEMFQHPELIIAGAALGSMLPDIDNPKSFIGRRTRFVSKIINKIMGHRTYMHDPVIWGPLSLYLISIHPELFGLCFGYLGHIFLDSFTAGGIPVFYLINKKMFHMLPYSMKFNSDSSAAKFVTFLVSASGIALTWCVANYEAIFHYLQEVIM